jgi:hypothetical protein
MNKFLSRVIYCEYKLKNEFKLVGIKIVFKDHSKSALVDGENERI